MTTSYGHGIAVTPLHLASAYAALVNGGLYRPATMLKLGEKPPPQGRRVFKASTSARMRQLLRLIVSDGTGKQADARSEEHTSELQSLMRISYAVFCLKKKNKKTTSHISTRQTN